MNIRRLSHEKGLLTSGTLFEMVRKFDFLVWRFRTFSSIEVINNLFDQEVDNTFFVSFYLTFLYCCDP